MKRLFLIALLLAAILPNVALANNKTKVKLDIYPIDCVFEIVNDGTNTLRFLTPEECGQNTFINVSPEVQTPVSITTTGTAPVTPTPEVPAPTLIAAQINTAIPPGAALPITWVIVSASVSMAQIAALIGRAILSSLVRLLRFVIGPPRT